MTGRGFAPYGPAGTGVEALAGATAADLAGTVLTEPPAGGARRSALPAVGQVAQGVERGAARTRNGAGTMSGGVRPVRAGRAPLPSACRFSPSSVRGEQRSRHA